MNKSKWTKVNCRRIIEENKDKTAYFNGEMSQDDMRYMLKYRMNFGDAETAVIMASLILAGAKFNQEVYI